MFFARRNFIFLPGTWKLCSILDQTYRWIIDGLFRIILALHSTVSEQTCEPCVLLRCWKPRVWGWDCSCLLYLCFMNVLGMFFLDVQWCLVALRGRCQGHSSRIRTAGSLEWRLSCAGTLATVQGRVVSAIGSVSCPTKCLDLRFAVSILHALKMECSKMECRAVWVFLILWPKWISEFVYSPYMIILSILIRSQWGFSTMLQWGKTTFCSSKAKGHGQAAALGPQMFLMLTWSD